MTVVQESENDNYKVLENVPTMASARTMSVDTRSHHLYLPAAEYNPVPEATSDNPRPRRTIKPDSFLVMDIAPVNQDKSLKK
jgi:hypothetical protein